MEHIGDLSDEEMKEYYPNAYIKMKASKNGVWYERGQDERVDAFIIEGKEEYLPEPVYLWQETSRETIEAFNRAFLQIEENNDEGSNMYEFDMPDLNSYEMNLN